MFESIAQSSISLIETGVKAAFIIAPIVLPIPLALIFWEMWVKYVRRLFFDKQKHVLLEIILPQNIDKSPAAMELFMNTFYQTGGEGTWYDRYWLGKARPWFSLEIVSKGGGVHFYIWTRESFKKLIESQIYAQYPGVEVHEVDDYIEEVDFDLSKYNLWGCIFKLDEPDPVPIKTYVDYGLHQNPDEEFKVDPITPVLEFFGSINEGEYLCMQIIVRAHKKEDPLPFNLFDWNTWNSDFNILDPFTWVKRTDKWKDDAKSLVKKIREESIIEVEENGIKKKIPTQTEGQKEKITAIERSVTKFAFDCGIRTLYFAEKDRYNGVNVTGLSGSLKQYNSSNLNRFVPVGGMTVFKGFPWEDIGGRRNRGVKEDLFNAYKLRSYFFDPYKEKPFVLNTEELATIYHFPGKVAQTPSFGRVLSKKAEPPANLPI